MHIARVFAAVAFALCYSGWAHAFIEGTRWATTASGPTGSRGDAITLTWSVVPDGTAIPGDVSAGSPGGNSTLKARLNAIYGSQSVWLPLLSQSFDRWGQLGGITFDYQSQDDGAAVQSTFPNGAASRGDVRIGGVPVDGNNGTLGYAWAPSSGDIVLDTNDNFFNSTLNNSHRLRNVLMHEIGHAFGLQHIVSSSDELLMERFYDGTINGPQLDDIRGLHRMYGDKFEKTNGGLGNDIVSRATSLGALASGASLQIGSDASSGQPVGSAEIDFVSLSNHVDVDYFSITVAAPSLLDVTLTPLGGIFSHGPQGGSESSLNANAQNNLALTVYATNGMTLLGSASANPAGQIEALSDVSLPAAGQYYVRVTGVNDAVQLYQLALSVTNSSVSLPGDYNSDSVVDAADYTIWRKTRNQTGPGLPADGNGDNTVNTTDYNIWRTNFGETPTGAGGAATSVPEPATFLLLSVAGMLSCSRRFSIRRSR